MNNTHNSIKHSWYLSEEVDSLQSDYKEGFVVTLNRIDYYVCSPKNGSHIVQTIEPMFQLWQKTPLQI